MNLQKAKLINNLINKMLKKKNLKNMFYVGAISSGLVKLGVMKGDQRYSQIYAVPTPM